MEKKTKRAQELFSTSLLRLKDATETAVPLCSVLYIHPQLPV